MTTKKQLGYYLVVRNRVNSYTGRNDSDVTLHVYQYEPDESYLGSSDKLFEVDFSTSQSLPNDTEGKTYGTSHPGNWVKYYRGQPFECWRQGYARLETSATHPDNLAERFADCAKVLKRINDTFDGYNLREKYNRCDILSTWIEALRVLKFEQLRYDNDKGRPVITGETKRQLHTTWYDLVF